MDQKPGCDHVAGVPRLVEQPGCGRVARPPPLLVQQFLNVEKYITNASH
jgi:hypothetical protein